MNTRNGTTQRVAAPHRRAGLCRALGAPLLVLLLGACARTHGDFVWVDAYPQQPATSASEYQIGSGDLLQVQVWDNEKLSTKGRVLANGNLGIPLVGEVPAAHRTPRQLATEIEGAFREQKLVLNPRVTVVVDEIVPLRVSVLGAVARAGTYVLEAGGGVAEALASAGGLTEFARRDQIYVLRKLPAPARIRFSFDALTEVGRAAAFRLQAGDVVVVE